VPTRPVSNNPGLDPTTPPVQRYAVPSGIGNLITLVDRCWVCDRVFPEYGGEDSGLVQEFHHPVPRAFGGASGPVVSLCSGHHANVHDVALRLAADAPSRDIVGHESQSSLNRIYHLAHVIVRAMNTFKEDPNRRVPLHFSLPFNRNEQLKVAARSRGLTVNQLLDKIIGSFLAAEYPKRRLEKTTK